MSLYEIFDKEIIDVMKNYGLDDIREYPHPEGIDTNLDIITVTIKEKSKKQCYRELCKLDKQGYIICMGDKTIKDNVESIFVLKSTDRYDILRAMGTNGINHDKDTEAIISKLKEWDKLYGIRIHSADFDWVDIEFNHIAMDLSKVARKIFDFCPDSVHQGAGTLERLEESLDMSHRVFLWWD